MPIHVGGRFLRGAQPRPPEQMSGRNEQKARALGVTSTTGLVIGSIVGSGVFTMPAVLDGYGTPQARPIRRTTARELRARSFPAGSMGPKVEAACRFVEKTGAVAAIGRLDDAAALLDGTVGATVVPERM